MGRPAVVRAGGCGRWSGAGTICGPRLERSRWLALWLGSTRSRVGLGNTGIARLMRAAEGQFYRDALKRARRLAEAALGYHAHRRRLSLMGISPRFEIWAQRSWRFPLAPPRSDACSSHQHELSCAALSSTPDTSVPRLSRSLRMTRLSRVTFAKHSRMHISHNLGVCLLAGQSSGILGRVRPISTSH